jgi:hypothetical protein
VDVAFSGIGEYRHSQSERAEEKSPERGEGDLGEDFEARGFDGFQTSLIRGYGDFGGASSTRLVTEV